MSQARIARELDYQARQVQGLIGDTLDVRKLSPMAWESRIFNALTDFDLFDGLQPFERREAFRAAREHSRLIAEGTRKRLIRSLKAHADIDSRTELGNVVKDAVFGEGRAKLIAKTENRFLRSAVDIARYDAIGAQYVVLSDGPGCGLRSHDDRDKADGKTVKLSTYRKYRLAHPNCRRRVIRIILPDEEQGPSRLTEAQAKRLARSRARRRRN